MPPQRDPAMAGPLDDPPRLDSLVEAGPGMR